MSRRIYWVSFRQLKAHEFHSTLRHLKRTGTSWADIYLRLGEIFQETTAKWLRILGSFLVIYLIVSSLGKDGLATVNIFSYTFSVPISHILAAASVLLLVSAQHLLTIISIMEIRNREALRIRLSRFSAGSFGLFNGQDEMALATPVMVNNFFSDKLGVLSLVGMSYMFALSLALGPILGFIIFLFSWQIELAFISPRNLLEGLVAFFSLWVNSIAIFYFFLFLIPLPLTKNAFGIRWGLLVRLHHPGLHPQLRFWIEEEERQRSIKQK
ncbi:MAG: hypothetical protein R3D90_03870 [Paracoccaceae bacterium]